jgi:hypothetical protein
MASSRRFDSAAKYKTSLLYEICLKLYPNEFKAMFTAPREAFRDWLNGKTGLQLDHIKNQHEALDGWIECLKDILAKKGQQP